MLATAVNTASDRNVARNGTPPRPSAPPHAPPPAPTPPATHVAWYLVRHAAAPDALRLTAASASHVARHAVSGVVQFRRACFPCNLHVRRLTDVLLSSAPIRKRNLHRSSQNFQRRTSVR